MSSVFNASSLTANTQRAGHSPTPTWRLEHSGLWKVSSSRKIGYYYLHYMSNFIGENGTNC